MSEQKKLVGRDQSINAEREAERDRGQLRGWKCDSALQFSVHPSEVCLDPSCILTTPFPPFFEESQFAASNRSIGDIAPKREGAFYLILRSCF